MIPYDTLYIYEIDGMIDQMGKGLLKDFGDKEFV